MRKLHNVSINKFINISTALIIGYILFIGTIDYVATHEFDKRIEVSTNRNILLQEKIGKLKHIVTNTQRTALQAALQKDENLLLLAAIEANHFHDLIDEIQTILNNEDNILHFLDRKNNNYLSETETVNTLAAELKQEYKHYLADNLSIAAKIAEGIDASSAELDILKTGQKTFNQRLDILINATSIAARNDMDNIRSLIQLPAYFHAFSVTTILLLVLFFRVFITKRLTTPLEGTLNFLKNISTKNLYEKQRLPVNGTDEISTLARNINLMLENIEKITVSKDLMQVAKDEAEKAGKAKSTFLSQMSHELRTPLNAIIGMGQLLCEDADPKGEQKQNLQDIVDAGNHLLRLINDVLDLSTLDAGKMSLHLSPVNIYKSLQTCIKLVSPLAANKNITIVNTINDVDLYCSSDKLRLNQVFINLLSNVIKYNQDNGSITIKSGESDKKNIRIEIIDNGIGIDASNIDKLFQPFNRFKSSEIHIDGTGIGLTISKQLVELMGGTIGVHSELGKGSRFWVELEREAAPFEEINSSEKIPNKPLRTNIDQIYSVLYVEDNPVNMLIVKKALSKLPYIRFHSAETPSEAIKIACEHHLDLILLDLTLPEMNGYTLLKKLRHDFVDPAIPAIAVSANALQSDIDRSREEGFCLHITKPIDIYNFQLAVENTLIKNHH